MNIKSVLLSSTVITALLFATPTMAFTEYQQRKIDDYSKAEREAAQAGATIDSAWSDYERSLAWQRYYQAMADAKQAQHDFDETLPGGSLYRR